MEPLRTVLEQVARRTPPPAAPRGANLNTALAWRLAAGDDLARQTRVASLRDGVLRIEFDDAGAGRRVQSVAPELCRALSRILGAHVTRLETAPRPPAALKHPEKRVTV